MMLPPAVGTLNANLPSASVELPVFVPAIKTETPANGSLESPSVTTPSKERFCAIPLNAEARRNRMSRKFLVM
jgi:hypothetical protein